MARISAETRARNEQAIRAAMELLLSGEVPPDGSTDLTLGIQRNWVI